VIPNIFISSTIADLQYLRDGLRDAVNDLRYHPVMSEHGEVGYLRPTTAADACYRTVEQCQMVVLIIGKRYGSIGSDGLSVTHKEYRAAQLSQIPTITFVEPQVLHYKDVFDSAPSAAIWNDFTRMDNPKNTFEFLEEIARSETYNAIIPFTSAADAKEKLKLQLADFIGERLGGTITPMSKQIKDILAEIKTLRNHLVNAGSGDKDTKRYLAVTRFLLNDSVADYRGLLELLFGEIDTAVEKIWNLNSFERVLKVAKVTFETVPEETIFNQVSEAHMRPAKPVDPKRKRAVFSHTGFGGGYILYSTNQMMISESYFKTFDHNQRALYAKAKVT
jgi:hypothetical protein